MLPRSCQATATPRPTSAATGNARTAAAGSGVTDLPRIPLQDHQVTNRKWYCGMSRGRILSVAGVLVAVLALPATAAGAGATRQIYADFASHGKLVGHYSKAEL